MCKDYLQPLEKTQVAEVLLTNFLWLGNILVFKNERRASHVERQEYTKSEIQKYDVQKTSGVSFVKEKCM